MAWLTSVSMEDQRFGWVTEKPNPATQEAFLHFTGFKLKQTHSLKPQRPQEGRQGSTREEKPKLPENHSCTLYGRHKPVLVSCWKLREQKHSDRSQKQAWPCGGGLLASSAISLRFQEHISSRTGNEQNKSQVQDPVVFCR